MPALRGGKTRERLLVVAAIVLYAAMAHFGTAKKSGTFDEHIHVAGGHSYWAFNDFRFHPENGNLAQRIVGLPSFLEGAHFPAVTDPVWRSASVWVAGDQFFFWSGNDAATLLRHARMMTTLVSALLALMVFGWSRQLFGRAGAWVSLIVFIFSPEFLAHGALATSDMIATTAFIAATWALWTAMHRLSVRTALLSMLAVGGLFVAKHSAIVFIPIALAMLAIRLIGPAPLHAAFGRRRVRLDRPMQRVPLLLGLTLAHVVAVVTLIWAAYGFRYSAFGPIPRQGEGFVNTWDQVTDSSVVSRAVQWSRRTETLPEAFLFGLSTVLKHSEGRSTFLNGEVREGGRRWFFPYAFLVKTTLPVLFLVAAIPLLLAYRRRTRNEPRLERIARTLYPLTPVLLLVGVYWSVAVISALNIGHRHLLPALAGTAILLGVVGEPVATMFRALAERRREGAATLRDFLAVDRRLVNDGALVVALLSWHAVESIRIAPDYLAYFNPIAGGPSHAYRHLVDSSLDWGQDLPGLKAWLTENGLQGKTEHAPVFLSYFGTSRPDYYGIEAVKLPWFIDRSERRIPPPLTSGVYAISATMLQAVYLAEGTGAWSENKERRYQIAAGNMRLFNSTANSPSGRAALFKMSGEGAWYTIFRIYEQLRFARLAAYLRQREPDANVGYSILIYRVGDSELSRALNGPPP